MKKTKLNTGIVTIQRKGKIEVLTAKEFQAYTEHQNKKITNVITLILVLGSIFCMCMGWTDNQLN